MLGLHHLLLNVTAATAAITAVPFPDIMTLIY